MAKGGYEKAKPVGLAISHLFKLRIKRVILQLRRKATLANETKPKLAADNSQRTVFAIGRIENIAAIDDLLALPKAPFSAFVKSP